MSEILLPCYGITVCVDEDNPGGGQLVSDLKDVCPVCNEVDCYFSCDLSQADKPDIPESTESEEDVDNRKKYNAAMDGIESLILAHAVAGLDIESLAYIEGIETAVQACAYFS